jgi:hypothetical protein
LLLICCSLGSSQTASAQPGESEAKPTLEEARKKLESALSDKTNSLSNELEASARKFLEAAKRPDDIEKLKTSAADLQRALSAEQARSAKSGKPFREGDKVLAIRETIQAASEVTAGTGKGLTGSPSPPRSPASEKLDTSDSEGGLMSFILPIAGGIAGLGLIVLAVFGVLRMRTGFWVKLDDHVNGIVQAHANGLKRRQDELGKQLLTIGDEHKRTSNRLDAIESGLQTLGRIVRQGTADGSGYQGVRQAFDEYARQTPETVEPEFPASASEYLNKMKRNSTVVKPDFQNGILVSDIDGKGELVLIRDARISDEDQPLFVVPRVTQFQTKQEFHSYYERYYECQRPSAGDVWIIDPAVVSTVPGGWELRGKGVLEVR